MIGRLRGTWSEGVVDVGGVGYLVTAPRPPAEGAETTLHIHSQDSGGTTTLYGFVSTEELTLFRAMVDVPGVGPGAACRLLERYDAASISDAIRRKDLAMLAGVRGVGRRTAERLVQLCDTGRLPVGRPSEPGPADDAVRALVTLGWTETDAAAAIAAQQPEPGTGASELIRAALAQRRIGG